MDIEHQKIKIRVNNFNEEHFKKLGYNVKRNEYITIEVCELPNGSGIKINVQCRYCGKIFKKAYRKYLETKDDLCCDKCKTKKCEKTNIKKYGNKCSLRNDKILEKSKKTNLEKLGVEYPFQSKKILRKCEKTSIKKYGNKFREKNTSKQQKYLHKLYGGIINYHKKCFYLDIFFKKEKIYFEYDGSGHDLSVKFGNLTMEQFESNEKYREKVLAKSGLKEFRIVSNTDILPSDTELLKIKNRAFDILLNKGYSKYVYNLETKMESFEK